MYKTSKYTTKTAWIKVKLSLPTLNPPSKRLKSCYFNGYSYTNLTLSIYNIDDKKVNQTIDTSSHPLDPYISNNMNSGKSSNLDAFVVYPNGDAYEGFIRGKKRNGYGKMAYSMDNDPEVLSYEGEWVKDQRSGFGVQKYADGSTFEGTWHHNLQTDGTITWKDGSYYKGGFSGNHLQGEGTLVTKTEILKGAWKRSKLEGQGERVLVNDGSRYVGKWVKGKLTGHGEYVSESEHYTGHYFNNLEHGSGKKVYQDGTEYTGKWKDGLPHGFGKLTHPNGTYYKGHFLNGDRHGQGTFESQDEKYSGQFEYDLYHGDGKLKVHQKFEYKGSFSEGQFHGQGYLHLVDNIIYNGMWENGKKNGKGELRVVISADENATSNKYFYETYNGMFQNDMFNGQGKYQHADGSYYEGNFLNNERHGQGQLTTPDGKVYVGTFDNQTMTDKKGKVYKLGS